MADLVHLIDLLQAQQDGLDAHAQRNWRTNRSYLNEKIADTVYGPAQPSGSTGGPKTLVWWHHGLGRSVAPDFVGSLDEGIPGERIRFVLLMGDGRWEAEAICADGCYHKAVAVTEALARRIAALKAQDGS